MASEVKTNKISPATVTTVTLGDASDTFVIPASVTLDVNGIIDLTGSTKTGFPAGGLTQFSQWRLTTDFAGDATPIVSNLVEVASPVGFGKLPDEAAGEANSMALDTGIFTFPSTGYWLITFNPLWYTAETNAYVYGKIKTTPDDSNYSEAARAAASAGDGAPGDISAVCQYIFDVTSTSTHKVKFDIDIAGSTGTCLGNAAFNETHMTFMKLADA